MEDFIIKTKRYFLWGNNEANYYVFGRLIEGTVAVLKVSRIIGIRQEQSLLSEITNTKAVRQLIHVGILSITDTESISYLTTKCPGRMEKYLQKDTLTLEEKKQLQEDAISRYQNAPYYMINTYVLALSAGDMSSLFHVTQAHKR
jgi:hypothetical protein